MPTHGDDDRQRRFIETHVLYPDLPSHVMKQNMAAASSIKTEHLRMKTRGLCSLMKLLVHLGQDYSYSNVIRVGACQVWSQGHSKAYRQEIDDCQVYRLGVFKARLLFRVRIMGMFKANSDIVLWLNQDQGQGLHCRILIKVLINLLLLPVEGNGFHLFVCVGQLRHQSPARPPPPKKNENILTLINTYWRHCDRVIFNEFSFKIMYHTAVRKG